MSDPIVVKELISDEETILIDGFAEEISVEGTKPKAFWLNGRKYKTNAWLDLRVQIVSIACTGHPQVLLNATRGTDFEKDFATTQESRHWMRLDNFHGEVYLYAPRTADHSLKETQFLLKHTRSHRTYYIQIRKGRKEK